MRGTKILSSTLMVCTNAAGEKAPLMMIGKSKKPRAFYGIQKPSGIVYVHQENAWINSNIASMWFRQVFVPFKHLKLLEYPCYTTENGSIHV